MFATAKLASLGRSGHSARHFCKVCRRASEFWAFAGNAIGQLPQQTAWSAADPWRLASLIYLANAASDAAGAACHDPCAIDPARSFLRCDTSDGRTHAQQDSFVSPGENDNTILIILEMIIRKSCIIPGPCSEGLLDNKSCSPRGQDEVSALHPITCDVCADRREANPYRSRPAKS